MTIFYLDVTEFRQLQGNFVLQIKIENHNHENKTL